MTYIINTHNVQILMKTSLPCEDLTCVLIPTVINLSSTHSKFGHINMFNLNVNKIFC